MVDRPNPHGHPTHDRPGEHAGTRHVDERRVAALLWHFDRARRTVEQRATLGVADMRMLWMFADGEARTLRRITDELNLEQSTVNRQVNAAVTAGLLDRSGGRPYRFTISATGRAEFAANIDAAFAMHRAGLDALGEHRARFLEDLDTFVQAYATAVEGTDGPTDRERDTRRPG